MKTPIDLNNKTILVTGSPGFIGANLVLRLLSDLTSGTVVSFDNMNDYYDPQLKEYRLGLINNAAKTSSVKHVFIKGDISDKTLVDNVFRDYQPDIVVNLAAQAGVRYSIEHPEKYIESNIVGFYNVLEACRHSYDLASSQSCQPSPSSLPSKDSSGQRKQNGQSGQSGQTEKGSADDSSDSVPVDNQNSWKDETSEKQDNVYAGVQHLVYASSSSVYGGNKKVPFATEDPVDHPVSLYAATKKSNELLAHAYSKLYNIPSTGLRFFTVYGPAGRLDMFYFSATNKLARGEKIQIFNYGDMKRDFTYIDDIVEGIIRVMQGAPEKKTGEDGLPIPPYAVYNIGGGTPENLLDYISTLQEELVRAKVLPEDYDFEGHRELVGMQAGDVPITYADSTGLEEDYGFTPKIGIREGLRAFAEWYKEYYG